MNTSIFTLTIAEDPVQDFYENQLPLLELKATFKYLIKKKIFVEKFNLLIWGNLCNEIVNYYRKDDCVIVEGYLTISSEFNTNNLKNMEKKIELTVINISPFF
jgi:hypothetical protein